MKRMPVDAATVTKCFERDTPSAGPLWKVSDVARYLRLPVGSVYRMTGPKASYRIPHLRLRGRLLRFRKPDVDRWLDLMSVSSVKAMEKSRARILKGVVPDGHDSRAEAA